MDDLEEIVANEEEQEADQSHFSLDKEIAFHGKLYQISNNKTLQGFQHLLLPVFEYVHLKIHHKILNTDIHQDILLHTEC